MDATNLVLSELLLANSRRFYWELADRLSLSVNAVSRLVIERGNRGHAFAFPCPNVHSVHLPRNKTTVGRLVDVPFILPPVDIILAGSLTFLSSFPRWT